MRVGWVAVVVAGCEAAAPVGPDWHGDVAPILAARCSGCHGPDGIEASRDWTDPEVATRWAPAIAESVATRAMPPFSPALSTDCDNLWGFTHDPSLTDDEIDVVVAWADAGAPLGDPDTAAPIDPPDVDRLEGDVAVVQPAVGAALPTTDDAFVCWSVDPGLAATAITGFEVVPDHREALHHLFVVVDPTGAIRAPDGGDGPWDCPTPPGDRETTYLGTWFPGGGPVRAPEGSGWDLPDGARVILQAHYHAGDAGVVDRPALRVATGAVDPARAAQVWFAGNASHPYGDGVGLLPGPNDGTWPEFRIPAGSSGHVEEMAFELPFAEEVAVFAAWNHLHYLGTDLRTWIEHPDGTSTCLLHTPEFDFDWQATVGFDVAGGAAPVLRPGDRLRLRCTYDNDTGPRVARYLDENGLDAPVDVTVGDTARDEMCAVHLGLVPLP
jgi:hypothetical protein